MDGARYAITDEAVKAARHLVNPGAAGYVNALLRSVWRSPVDWTEYEPWQRESYDEGSYRLLSERLGQARVDAWLAASRRPLPLSLRLSGRASDALTDPDLQRAFAPARLAEPLFMPGAARLQLEGASLTELAAFREGLFYVQGEAAQLPVYLAAVRPGESVLDLCAAPGGKALQAADVLGGSGRVVALDISAARLERVRENMQRLGLEGIHVAEHDGRQALPADGPLAGPYDLVIADVPCSALGRLADLPEMRSRSLADMERELLPLQADLLDRAAEAVAQGGRLVYATCTINPRENRGQTEAFLARHGDSFRPLDLSGRLPQGLVGRPEWLCPNLEDGEVELLPHADGVEGFYIRIMARHG